MIKGWSFQTIVQSLVSWRKVWDLESHFKYWNFFHFLDHSFTFHKTNQYLLKLGSGNWKPRDVERRIPLLFGWMNPAWHSSYNGHTILSGIKRHWLGFSCQQIRWCGIKNLHLIVRLLSLSSLTQINHSCDQTFYVLLIQNC